MRNGNLIERVAFDEPAQVSDGQGGTIQGWTERFQCRAAYQRLRGTETVQAARLSGRQPTVITVRAAAATRDVETDWRIRDVRTGEIFNIRAIEVTPNRQYVELLAESGVAV